MAQPSTYHTPTSCTHLGALLIVNCDNTACFFWCPSYIEHDLRSTLCLSQTSPVAVFVSHRARPENASFQRWQGTSPPLLIGKLRTSIAYQGVVHCLLGLMASRPGALPCVWISLGAPAADKLGRTGRCTGEQHVPHVLRETRVIPSGCRLC